ncbi:CynX/NimT family MFS transporter [Staphylococcus schleiferi]|uniref:Putative transporter, major facilitator family n=1 Tax=Staphylococcus schleiferi TaxID=1295 RepID=A0A7Z7QN10_STASC|nr:MFS transporter [Staphylococcus schleiferi]QPA24552.1 MFS transporter [Mammaliicoccus fleurettii]MBF1993427.1 MFS transporter [Staphylococcus schleiferi]MBF2038896.1 MFS transporter [Staphylococcus schleiferi]MBF2100922.1 MFS transporter [Staphylococcus schleiferi]MBF2103166.1 MFS transporter [Staphylococcus schleiferi]
MEQQSNRINWLLFIGIMLIAANLRAPITSVGVVLPTIKDTLNLTNTEVSFISIIPLLAFAIISSLVAKVSHRFGMERSLFFAIALILIGVVIRSVTNVSLLYIGTILIGVGIAFGNVLAPGIIKSKFPMRIGIMTAYYTVVMNIFGALSSYGAAPLLKSFNYNIALGLIGVVTLIALIVWTFQLRNHEQQVTVDTTDAVNVWKSPLAWQITLLMGGQSLIFYSLINWLPEFLLSYDIPVTYAGLYLSILQLAIIPLTFVTPLYATKLRSQVIPTAFTGALFTIGILILIFSPHLALISLIIIGIALGIAFGLVNTFFSLRTESGLTAAKLAGMSQAVGYLFACIGPLFFGILHDVTGHWVFSLLILLLTAIAVMIIGARAGRNTTIEASLRK